MYKIKSTLKKFIKPLARDKTATNQAENIKISFASGYKPKQSQCINIINIINNK